MWHMTQSDVQAPFVFFLEPEKEVRPGLIWQLLKILSLTSPWLKGNHSGTTCHIKLHDSKKRLIYFQLSRKKRIASWWNGIFGKWNIYTYSVYLGVLAYLTSSLFKMKWLLPFIHDGNAPNIHTLQVRHPNSKPWENIELGTYEKLFSVL